MGRAGYSIRTLAGDPAIELVLRCSPRARRITLRVSSLDGRVTVTRPRGVSERAALDFADAKRRWIRARLDQRIAPRAVTMDATLPVLGIDRHVRPGRGGLEADALRVNPERPVGWQVRDIVKDAARAALAEAALGHADALGLSVGRITLRDTRSRWGSCSSAGNLNFSWRLALAPPEVLDYVAVHEVAHLRHLDHSRAFWSVVEERCTDWRRHRDWLRANGSALHAWRFDG